MSRGGLKQVEPEVAAHALHNTKETAECGLHQDNIRLSLPLVIEALIKRSYRFPRLCLAIVFPKPIPRRLKLSRHFVR